MHISIDKYKYIILNIILNGKIVNYNTVVNNCLWILQNLGCLKTTAYIAWWEQLYVLSLCANNSAVVYVRSVLFIWLHLTSHLSDDDHAGFVLTINFKAFINWLVKVFSFHRLLLIISFRIKIPFTLGFITLLSKEARCLWATSLWLYFILNNLRTAVIFILSAWQG